MNCFLIDSETSAYEENEIYIPNRGSAYSAYMLKLSY